MGYRQSNWAMSAGRWTTEARGLGCAMEATVDMPLEQDERRTDQPAGVATVSRRAVVRAALGTWLGAHVGSHVGKHAPSRESATPIAGQAAEPQSGLTLPAGIRVAQRCRADIGPPASGGALRLVRPGESLGNFNPSAFRQDPQIPLELPGAARSS